MRLRPVDQDIKTKLRRLDWGGMFLFTLGATCISLPISWADALYPWSSWRSILTLVIGVIAFIAFGIYEARPIQPMLPYRLFQNRTAVVSLIGGTIHGLLMFAFLLYLPLFFQVSLRIIALLLRYRRTMETPVSSNCSGTLTRDRPSICKRPWNQLSLFFQHVWSV